MKYRNRIQEPGTTIPRFADSLKKKINADRPTLHYYHLKIVSTINAMYNCYMYIFAILLDQFKS
jgi:hypothetical protein